MSDIIAPKDDVMFSSSTDVDTISQPLKDVGISFFSHSRIYNDGSRFDLNNDPYMSDYFYYQSECYKGYTPEIIPRDFDDGFVLGNSLEGNDSIRILRENFNIDNMIVIIEPYKNYCDIWNFGTKRNDYKAVNFYMNNLDVLKRFTYYFKEQGAPLIKAHDADRIIIKDTAPQEGRNINYNIEYLQTREKRERLLSNLQTNRYHLGEAYGNVYLTKREVECVYWCARAKTADEIATILSIAKRTAEAHLENAKRKLKCSKQSQLIQKMVDLGIIDVL